MKRFLALVLTLALAISLVACGGAAASAPAADTSAAAPASGAATGEVKNLKIGVSIMELTAYTWYQGVIDGCNKWMEDNGAANNVNLTFDFEDSHSDVSTMLNNLDNMVASGCDGVILFPADASSAIPTMKQYVGQGVPFIVGDYAQETKSDDDVVWSTFVGHDMKALGVKAGETAVEYLKTLGKEDPTCLFITVPGSGQVSADRFNGFKETVLAAFPKAKIIEEGDTGAHNRDSAQTLTENILQREATIDVVCGHNDAEVVGAYNAAMQQNRTEIKFIGIAGDIDVLKWLADGNENWLGEVLQDPVVLGYQATDAIYKVLANGETLDAKYALPEPEVITAANIADYDWQNWGWLG